MKVFWLKKVEDEREMPLYRGYEDAKNISKITIKDDSSFKYLCISNSEDSNHICTLYNLEVKTEEENITKLHIGDEMSSYRKLTQADYLDIAYDFCTSIGSNHIELEPCKTPSNILKDNYVILLPKGNLIIELQKAIKKIDLKIQYTLLEL